MADFKLFPLVTFHMENEYSMMTNRSHYGEKKIIPVIFWLIEGNGRNILVDCGPSENADLTMTLNGAYDGLIPVRKVMKDAGVEAEDIDTVILPHLHWDRCGCLGLFPNAKVIVQSEEIKYAGEPLPHHVCDYGITRGDEELPWREHMGRMEILDGDCNVCEGIKVLQARGHTPGMQAVLVHTEYGEALIAGDSVPLAGNWCGLGKQKHFPAAVHYKLSEYYPTLESFERICKVIYPGNEEKPIPVQALP